MAKVVSALRRVAFFLRQVGALVALILSVRILWLSAVAGIAHAKSNPTGFESPSPEPQSAPVKAQNAHRPNLEELQSMVSKPPEQKEIAPPPPPVPTQRRILVDVGPARSEVFIGKKNVGMTPFGGQIACLSGEEIKIQVLPPKGIPIQRRVMCLGETLLVQE